MEIEVINAYNVRHPAHSFDYYYTVHRPVLYSHIDYSVGSEFFAGVPVSEPSAGARRLLDLAVKHQALSEEEIRALEEEPLSHDDYWKRFDSSPHDHLEWYMNQHYAKETRRRAIVDKARRRLLQVNETLGGPQPDGPQKVHPFSAELHRKVKCKSHHCGGHGTAMPHPVHKLRDMSWERKRQPTGSRWKDREHTEEEHQRSRFIHITAWSQAALKAKDKLAWHMQNPLLHKHFRNAWNRTTGFEDVHSAHEHFSKEYPDASYVIHDLFCGMTDWGPFKVLKREDPERHTRQYCSDWLRTKRVEERRTRAGRRVLEIMFDEDNADGQEREAARRALLSVHPEDEEYHATVLANMRGLLADPELPFRPNPIPNSDSVNADLADRVNRVEGQRPKPDAGLPLFALLGADCYTSSPRNPLCLPEIPASWRITKCPEFVWPENFTIPQDCSYLYTPIPRTPFTFFTVLSWDWIWNGIQSIRLFFSLFPLFTTTIGIFTEKWPWAAFIFRPFLALPPGKTPEPRDWFCFVEFAPYSLWLLAFLSWLFYVFIWPYIELAADVLLSWGAFVGTFAAADELRHESMRQTSHLFWRAAYDSDMNPGVRFHGDHDYFKRDYTGRRPTYQMPLGPGDLSRNAAPPGRQFDSYEEATRHAQSAGRYHRSSLLPMQALSPHERFNSMSPYAASEDGTSLEFGREPYASPVPVVEPAGAAIGHGGAEADERRAREVGRNIATQELEQLEAELLRCTRAYGVPRSWLARLLPDSTHWSVRMAQWTLKRACGEHLLRANLEDFEYRFNPFLMSFQYSIWWMFQYSNYVRERTRVQWLYSPVHGSYRRGFTHASRDDIDSRDDDGPEHTEPHAREPGGGVTLV